MKGKRAKPIVRVMLSTAAIEPQWHLTPRGSFVALCGARARQEPTRGPWRICAHCADQDHTLAPGLRLATDLASVDVEKRQAGLFEPAPLLVEAAP